MLRYLTATKLVILLALATNVSAARNTQSFRKLSNDILETIESFWPVQATAAGIHSYDNRLADYSTNSAKNMRKKLTEYSKQLYKYRSVELSVADRIDFRLIKSNVDIALLDLKQIKWHTRSPQLYVDEAQDGLYTLLLSQHAPLSEKLFSIIARMKAVPALFKTAQRNIKKPPPVYVELAQETLEETIGFYRKVAGELMSQFPDKADEILKVSTQARESMNDFLTFLAQIEPGEPGSFAIGQKNFDYKLTNEYFLDYDSDSLLKIGEYLFAEADREYHDYQQYVENNHQNGKDSIFVPASFTRQDVLDYYQWEVGQAKVFLAASGLVELPEDIAPLEVVETPPFLRSMVGGIAYQPAGPFDHKQTGYFYVRPVPEDLDQKQLAARYRYIHRRGFRGSLVHEGYPGHHLQMQLAGRHASAVRKWQSNPMLVEGWALYCEEMMYHAGLYGEEDPAMWLAILGGIRFRAARIIADVKLHTGQFSFEEAVEFMIDRLDAETDSDKSYHRKMVRKYTLTPTHWMSYLMGKREIERLRDDYATSQGSAFSESEFYTQLLSQGSVPPAFIREALGLNKSP